MTEYSEESDRLIVLEQRVHYMENSLERVKADVSAMRQTLELMNRDLFAAKVGGRWLMGAALAFGSLLGWVVKIWLDYRKT